MLYFLLSVHYFRKCSFCICTKEGELVLIFPRGKTNFNQHLLQCAALASLLIIVGLNLAVGFLPHVDNSAHVGGFLAGFFLGFVLLMRPQYGYVNRKYIPPGYDVKRKSKYKCYQYFFLFVSLIILILG